MSRAVGPYPLKRGALVTEVRPLTREDLAEILEPRQASVVKRLRDPHHAVARLIAAGLRPANVAARTGYSVQSVNGLNTDPAFKELVASYRKDVNDAFVASQDEFYTLATKNMVMAERMLSEKLEEHDEAGTLPPVRDLLAISRDAADRFGYGKKTTNVNVNVDFASKLEKAIARSQGVTIDNAPTISPGPATPLPVVQRRA